MGPSSLYFALTPVLHQLVCKVDDAFIRLQGLLCSEQHDGPQRAHIQITSM
jgi:hypothetical protein